jgi:hypothetical protein
MATRVKKSSWIVPTIASVAAIGVLAAWDIWFSPVPPVAGFVAFALVTVGFLYAYLSDKERMWWAVIPGLGAASLMGALASDAVVGTDPANDWAGVAVLGFGMTITGAVLKRIDAKTVLYIIAMITLGVAALMAPVTAGLKIVLVAIDVSVFVYGIWRTRTRLRITTGVD